MSHKNSYTAHISWEIWADFDWREPFWDGIGEIQPISIMIQFVVNHKSHKEVILKCRLYPESVISSGKVNERFIERHLQYTDIWKFFLSPEIMDRITEDIWKLYQKARLERPHRTGRLCGITIQHQDEQPIQHRGSISG